MPGRTGDISTNPDISSYQGPTESSSVSGGTGGTASAAPEYVAPDTSYQLPAAGETTYGTFDAGPSMAEIAAAQAAARAEQIRRENEAKRKSNDQHIRDASLKEQGERNQKKAPVTTSVQTKATSNRKASPNNEEQKKPISQVDINQPIVNESDVEQDQSAKPNLEPKVSVKNEPAAHAQSPDNSVASEKKNRQKRKKEYVDYFTQVQSGTKSKQFKKESKPKRKPSPARDTDHGVWQGPVPGVSPKTGVIGIGELRNVTEMPLPYGGELPINAIVRANLQGGPLVRKGYPGELATIDNRTFGDLFPDDNASYYVTPEGVAYPGEQPINAIVKANLGKTDLVSFGETGVTADPERPWRTEGPTHPWMASQWGVASQKALPGSIGYYNYAVSRNQKDKRSEEEIINDSIKNQASTVDYNQMYPNMKDIKVDYTSFEEYADDYRRGVDENGEDLRARGRYNFDTLNKMVANLKQSIDRIFQWYNEAYIPLRSEHIDERGYIRYEERTEAAIVNFMNYLGLAPEERYLVMKMAVKSLGFTPDRKGLFFSKSEREKIDDEIFIEALNNMLVSCKEYGHPYGFVNRGMFLGGTRCYPIGIPDPDELRILCSSGHIFEDIDELELLNRCADTWVNETYPNIRKNVYRQENGEAQMVMLEDFARMLCLLHGIPPYKFGLSDGLDRGYNVMKDECMPGYKLNEDQDDIAVNNRRRRILDLSRKRYERSFDRLDRRRNRVYQVYDEDVVDSNGVIIHRKGDKVKKNDEDNLARTKYIRNPKANAFSSVCMSVANMAKFAGVVGYVPIMASGVIEHAQGNVNAKVSNAILFGRFNPFNPHNNDAYVPNNSMYAYITSEEGVEAIAAWKSLMHVGGQDALIMFFNDEIGYKVLNKENAQKFINEYVKQKGSEALVPRKLKELMSRAEEAVSWLMPGDIGFGKADARRWLEGFMLNNMYNANDPLGLEHSFDSQQVLEMMNAMGIQRFLAAATEMNAGRDAMIMARNQTFDRVSPITYIVDSILRRNGVTNMFVTLGIDTYFTYGLNLVQMMIPFSNTASYLAVKGINMLATGGRSNTDQLDLNILNYQMGGNDEFGIGLRKNVVYDCVKLGNICLIAGFMYFVIAALGFDEPEAPWNKYVWSEYRIGRNLNLGGNDENGNPTGIPVYAAWWLNDLTMFALPMAYALNARNLDQKLGDNDPELANKLFFSGCHDMLSGCSLLDLIKTVNNAQRDFESYEQMMQDPDMDCPPDWFSVGALQAELFCARGINKFVPNALKSLRTDTLIVGENALDHDAYKVYDRESENPMKTEYVDDWFELQRRIESKYNPIYALYNNLTKNGYLFDDGTTGKTGYLFDEMPISTAKDPQRMTWAHKYDFDPDNIPGGEENRIPYTESLMDQVIADIGSFNSVDEALSQGYMIPYELRFKMRDYCYQHINFEENLFNQRLQEGWLPSAEYEDAKSQMKEKQNYWYNILNNWVFNDDIPWSDDGYAKLITSNQDIYYYKDSGKPATKFDYWELGPETVEQRFLPRGDHPTSFMPFTTPDNRGRVFDYQTKANWFKEGESGSNLQEIFNRNEESQAKVPYGRDSDVYTNTAIFGGDPRFKTNEPIEANNYISTNQASMGYRAYVPWEDEFLFNLPNFNGYINEDGKLVRGNGSKVSTTQALFDGLKAKDRKNVDGNSSMGDMGIYKDKNEWKQSSYPSYSNRSWSYGGRSYYGGSGSSGSNYNPKIYSTHVTSTNVSSSRISNTRTNPDSRNVTADRAATMYSKQPQDTRVNTYLRPGFSTKGSREAYKRQDI